MPLLVDIVQQLSPATNQSQVVNFPALGSATPKAIIAIAGGDTSLGTTAKAARLCCGMATAVLNQYVMGYFARHNVSSTTARHARFDDQLLTLETDNQNRMLAAITAINPGAITVNFTNTQVQSLVTYVALSGDTITNATVAAWSHLASTGVDPATPTLVGFQPDCGILMTNAAQTTGNIALGYHQCDQSKRGSRYERKEIFGIACPSPAERNRW